jgi:hypothetical protein
LAIEAVAMAALRKTSRVMLFRPAMSHTGLNMMMSLAPTKGRVKPEAMVDTITLGMP